jgi:hypothetical protein
MESGLFLFCLRIPMPFSRALAAFALGCVLLHAVAVRGQESDPLIEQHAWGKFPVGTWKIVRVITETLDDRGQTSNVTLTETRTTLVATTADDYTLRIESTVEVAGKRFASQPQLVKQGYFGENGGPKPTIKELGQAELSVDGRAIKCELRQLTVEADGVKRVSTIHFSPQVAPYQLRRETVTEGAPEDQQNSTLVEVVALQLPHRIIDTLRPAAVVKTTWKHSQGIKVTLEVHGDDVPGTVISHSASETDATGRTVRRSTLELLDYAIGGQEQSPDPAVRRRFSRRARRKG